MIDFYHTMKPFSPIAFKKNMKMTECTSGYNELLRVSALPHKVKLQSVGGIRPPHE